MRFTRSLGNNLNYRRVYQQGRSRADRLLVLYLVENGGEENHLGISVSKKVGNSVVRHRVTRLIRESYRLHEERFRRGLDLAFIARAGAREASFHEIEDAVLHLSRISHILLDK